jgi:hypothetical protein
MFLIILICILSIVGLFFLYQHILEENAKRLYFEQKEKELKQQSQIRNKDILKGKINLFVSKIEELGYFKYVDIDKLQKCKDVFRANLSKKEFGVNNVISFVNNYWVVVEEQTDFRSGPNICENVFYINSLGYKENTYEVEHYREIFESLLPFFKKRGFIPKIDYRKKHIVIENEFIEMESTIDSFTEKSTPGEFICWLINKILLKNKSEERVVATQMGEGEFILFLDKNLYFFIKKNINKKQLDLEMSLDSDVW